MRKHGRVVEQAVLVVAEVNDAVQTAVQRRRVKPCSKRFPHAPPGAHQLDEALLRHLLRVGLILEHAPARAENQATVTRGQLREGAGVFAWPAVCMPRRLVDAVQRRTRFPAMRLILFPKRP